MQWMNYSSLSHLYINTWKKSSSFIQMDETWENKQFKKKINKHLTWLNQLEVLWYSQSDISRSPPFWKSIYLSFEMSERNISLRVYLQMMYFLSVIGMGGSSGCVCVCGRSVIWLRTPSRLCPRIFKIYATNIYQFSGLSFKLGNFPDTPRKKYGSAHNRNFTGKVQFIWNTGSSIKLIVQLSLSKVRLSICF